MSCSKFLKYSILNKTLGLTTRPTSSLVPRLMQTGSNASNYSKWVNRGMPEIIPKISPFNSFAYTNIRITYTKSRRRPIDAKVNFVANNNYNRASDNEEAGTAAKENRIEMKEYVVLIDPTEDTKDPLPEGTLQRVAITSAMPFIGFGFLDNFIMIVAGDYIDSVFGTVFCISTMAAAALGNTLSDVVGIGSTYYVEKLAEAMGFKAPPLTPEQANKRICRLVKAAGRIVGILIGCFLGMLPLLFITEKITEQKTVSASNASTDPTTEMKTVKKVYSIPSWLRLKSNQEVNKDKQLRATNEKVQINKGTDAPPCSQKVNKDC